MIYLGAERADEARIEFEAVLAGEKNEHYYLALYQLARQRIEAEEQLELALTAMREYAADAPLADLLPSHAAAHWRAGNALALLGRTRLAHASYERSLELDPDFERARKDLKELPRARD